MQNKHRLATMETDFDLHSRYSLKFDFLLNTFQSIEHAQCTWNDLTPVLKGLGMLA